MMTTEHTRSAITISGSWVDIVNDGVIGDPTLAGMPVSITSKSVNGETIYVVFGGASAPDGGASNLGDALMSYGDTTTGQASNIWVRSEARIVGTDYVSLCKLEG